MLTHITKKRIISITIVALFFGLCFYALRGPNISNALKKLILPELEHITGKKFIAQHIYINLFPLFIEMKDIKAFDDDGTRIISAERVKGYVGISGVLKKEIVIKRLVVKNADITSYRQQAEEIADNIKKYLAEETKMPFKVVIRSVDIGSTAIYFQEGRARASVKSLNAQIILSEAPRFRLTATEVKFIKDGLPDFYGMLGTYFIVKEKNIELKSLKLLSLGSEIKTSGVFTMQKESGEFQTEATLLLESVKRIFGLKNRGEGKIAAKGVIKLDLLKAGFKKIFVDVRVKTDMYLETLMELLKVKENLKGHVNAEGEIKGYLNDLNGKGRAKIESGILFDVDVTRLNCNISYKDGIMKFSEGNALLYSGSASVEAQITLPEVSHYSLKVKAKDVNSKGLFKLIKWDPGIPAGKVSGEITSSGSEFNPLGSFSYRSLPKGGDILDRIHEIKGDFEMKSDVIHFDNMHIATDKSDILAGGDIDLKKNTLSFSGSGTTTDIRDFSSPYFNALRGGGSFKCSVNGELEDPVTDLKISSNSLLLSTGDLGISDVLKNRTVALQSVEWALNYRKNLLIVKSLSAKSSKEEFKATGSVYFKKARDLFDLKEPDYDLNISVKNIDIKALANTFHDGPAFGGAANADFRLFGKPDDIRASGGFSANSFSLYDKYSAESASGKVSYEKRTFFFDPLNVKKGGSSLSVKGRISLEKNFSFIAEGQQINIFDVIPEINLKHPASQIIKTVSLGQMHMHGEGTLESPQIEIQSDINGGVFRGHPLGRGKLNALLKSRHLDVKASFLDSKLNIKGGVELTESLPWSVRADMQPARYDFIIAGFLKDLPEDLLLSLSGNITAAGDRNHVNAVATISRAHLNLYGIGFTNSSDIIARLDDKRLSIGIVSMKGDTTEFRLSGNMVIGKSYDLLLEGSSSLAPLKALSKTIDVIKGNTSLVLSVSGDWDKPKISGGMDISNGTLGFKDIPYRLTSISAYIYMDEDRIVIEKAAGKLSGGDVSLSGTAYLQRFSIKRFFLESRLNNITATVSKDFWVNFDGNLYYRGTMESQSILGDIRLKKARYVERIEWKSWLLRARPKERPRVELAKLDRTNLNIRVSGSNLMIDNNVANASMKMDVLLRGTIGQPILLGKLETKAGIVYFRNNEFKVLKASMDFSNPNQINPYFDIVAETRVRNYNIRLALDGYIEQFNLSLSSDPPLNETDIFSLLTVGQIGKNLKGLEGGIGAGEATAFITGKMQDVVEERLKTVTGFDRVQIDPYISKSTGTITPRVTIAKRLMGDRLYVTYSTSVGTGEEQIWKLEYLLGKNTSLMGLRDERGGIGGDIKFRFEFK